MQKRIICYILVVLLGSCSTGVQVTTKEAPDWVNELRKGDSTFLIRNAGKILFRSNYKHHNDDNPNITCQKSVDQNIDFIKKRYPFIDQIPMTIELVFYDPILKDCSSTISIDNSLISNLNAFRELKNNFDTEKERLATEFNKVKSNLDEELNRTSVELEIQKSKNNELNHKIQSLKNYINNNTEIANKINSIEGILSSYTNRIQKESQFINGYIYSGMREFEVKGLVSSFFDAEFSEYVFRNMYTSSVCNEYFYDTIAYRLYGYLLCFEKDYLRGFCLLGKDKNTCYTKLLPVSGGVPNQLSK